jgi:hypothetical protein
MPMMLSGLFGAAVAAALAAIASRRQKPASWRHGGWKALRPGWFSKLEIAGCAAFASFMVWFLATGGSTRPDAATQNLVGVLLLCACLAGAAWAGWAAYGRTIMWRGDELRVRTVFGRESVRRISDVKDVTESDVRGDYRVTFRDGSTLRFATHFHGSRELVTRLKRREFRR